MALGESSYLVPILPVPRGSACVLTSVWFVTRMGLCHHRHDQDPESLHPKPTLGLLYSHSLLPPGPWPLTNTDRFYLPTLSCHVCCRNSITLYVSLWVWLLLLGDIPVVHLRAVCQWWLGGHSWGVSHSVGAPVSLWVCQRPVACLSPSSSSEGFTFDAVQFIGFSFYGSCFWCAVFIKPHVPEIFVSSLIF